VKNALRVLLARFATAIVSNSAQGDRYWVKSGLAGITRFVVPNGVPLAELQAVRERMARSNRSEAIPQLVYVGRLAATKNVETLLRALADLRARGFPFRAALYGDGPERHALTRSIMALGLSDRVELAGFSDAVWERVACADLFVSPSLSEGHPNSVLEAMALGCPVVASDIPEHRAFLDDASAWLVDPHSPQAFATSIENAIQCPSESLRRRDSAERIVTRFSVEAMAASYRDIYEQLTPGIRSTP
jgi:glycosyltransferase involved in cell wall biosynthesis